MFPMVTCVENYSHNWSKASLDKKRSLIVNALNRLLQKYEQKLDTTSIFFGSRLTSIPNLDLDEVFSLRDLLNANDFEVITDTTIFQRTYDLIASMLSMPSNQNIWLQTKLFPNSKLTWNSAIKNVSLLDGLHFFSDFCLKRLLTLQIPGQANTRTAAKSAALPQAKP